MTFGQFHEGRFHIHDFGLEHSNSRSLGMDEIVQFFDFQFSLFKSNRNAIDLVVDLSDSLADPRNLERDQFRSLVHHLHVNDLENPQLAIDFMRSVSLSKLIRPYFQ